MDTYNIVNRKNKSLIIEFCPEDGSGLAWIVWDKSTNTSPSGWLDSKAEAEQFIKQKEEA